jgi:3-dehydroshikimate dehydratase
MVLPLFSVVRFRAASAKTNNDRIKSTALPKAMIAFDTQPRNSCELENPMLTSGLVSVTFRQLAPRKIVELAVAAGLRGIEWGGDIHVPAGDIQAARAVRQITADAGLRVIAYGSYFRFQPGAAFEPVLETAVALGAPLIRIWAGGRPSAETDDDARAMLVAESRRIARLSSQANVTLAYEFHEHTLTDTTESALALLQAAKGMRTLWQPPHKIEPAAQLDSLRAILPWLTNVHAFAWRGAAHERLPLANGAKLWQPALNIIASSGRDHAVLLEFVAGDDPRNLLRDAATLNAWLERQSSIPE